MNDRSNAADHLDPPLAVSGGDLIQPFSIEGRAVNGRLVRLGPLLDSVLARHAYPDPVATLLTEMLTLAALLAGALKYDGVFTLQAKGDGPVRLMVADVTSAGDMRGYAQFDTARLGAAMARLERGAAPAPGLLGAGHLALTVDQGQHTERYQGIVELSGATLVDCLHHYFRQSEQIQAAIKIAVDQNSSPEGSRRAGAVMLQRLPPEGTSAEDRDDAWRRALSLMARCAPSELVDFEFAPNDLLYRLFHEDGVRVYRPIALRPGCRCSRGRVEGVLRLLPATEIESCKIDGRITVTCEFCNSRYDFAEGELGFLTAP
jgi:molecular chaperone Hsp33